MIISRMGAEQGLGRSRSTAACCGGGGGDAASPPSSRARLTAAARPSRPSPQRRAASACLSFTDVPTSTKSSMPLRSHRHSRRLNVHLLAPAPLVSTALEAARQGGGIPSQVSPSAGADSGPLRTMVDGGSGDPDTGAVVPIGMWQRPAKRHCDAAPPTACRARYDIDTHDASPKGSADSL